jgi:hypothetical protein
VSEETKKCFECGNPVTSPFQGVWTQHCSYDCVQNSMLRCMGGPKRSVDYSTFVEMLSKTSIYYDEDEKDTIKIYDDVNGVVMTFKFKDGKLDDVEGAK